ncbi:SctK family type III secretion system sorting platform protein [Bordetella sp. BOR01]|uniref:SctK family type III secretion system sorting platform protein n=1 Tax=Bordetella sp. BOR01 TaxID=2854779 RepID=UPI001C48E850|nr:SctK family type III secretion system sorting platform protein [Bordetella sp. BOR01]MBV7485200.1 Yop proteins translocation protein K [Bordetella sp. BOR01]
MTDLAALFGARLVAFNQLPSRTLHPSRHAEFAPDGIALPGRLDGAWHRHWSREILARIGMLHRPVRDPAQPALALALLPAVRLEHCTRMIGVTLCAPHLRQVIAGSEVRQLIATLGQDALAFAREPAAALHPGWAAGNTLSATVSAQEVDQLGRATLVAALRPGGPEILARAELKLPAMPVGDAPCSEPEALALALGVLKTIEPSWHSSFPAIR